MAFSEKDWRKLLKIFEQRECVLMLGSDIPSGADNSQPPLSTLLARQLACQISDHAAICNQDDLPNVAQNYLAKQGGISGSFDLQMEVEDFYKAHRTETTALHLSLANLPFKYCISTTADAAMENAFRAVGKQPLSAFYHFKGGNQGLPGNTQVDKPLIYHLYGSIADSRSLVLAETDLLDFLANIICGNPKLPPALGHILADSNTSFLFIGFGFQQWYLRVLLHVFRAKQRSARPWSVALENTRFFEEPMYHSVAWFYGDKHAIEFKNCDWNGFAAELNRRYRQHVAELAPAPEPELPADAPVVFLCHCSEDGEAVGLLGQKLRGKGLNTWRDRDNLRGGDNWDNKIKHLIESRAVHYFLVLQTPAMLAPCESYFVTEIKTALELQKSVWDEYLFIVPAYLAGNGQTKLDALKRLNYLDLRQDQDLDRLVQNIQDDQRKRLARKEWAHAG